MEKDDSSSAFGCIFFVVMLVVTWFGVSKLFEFLSYSDYPNFPQETYDVIVGKPNIDFKEEYIYYSSITAKEMGKKYNIYPSVMIAQSILESDWGRSELSSKSNNYFGIKGSYNNQSDEYLTSEEDKDGNYYNVMANFRKYPNKYISFEDNGSLLRNNDIYKGTWRENTKDYTDATYSLTGVYATDSSYGTKLNQLIEEYDLTRFD